LNGDLVTLGKDPVIEDNVVIGRPPDRDIEVNPLVIGDRARIRSASVLYLCSTIGADLETGHNVLIREQNVIGDGLSIWTGSVIDYGCRLGSRIKIHCMCYVAQLTEIEDDVFLGPGVMITNDFHPGCEKLRECMRGPSIRAGAIIGANATILPRVVIGPKAFVGAGSVVVEDVPGGVVVAGNPAKPMKSINDLKCKTGLTEVPYEA